MGFSLSKTLKKIGGAAKKVAPYAAAYYTGGKSVGATGLPGLTDTNSAGSLWDTLLGWGGKAIDFAKDNASSALELAGAKYGYDQQLKGIQEQNASAKSIADSANQMSQANAREQMAFQASQSATAHQREVQDLRAAGLNPILSGTGGMGASAGSGASGSVTTAPVRSEGDAMSSAFQMFKTLAETMKTRADTDYVREVQTPATKQSTEESKSRQGNIQTDTRNKEALNTQINESTHKISQEISNLKAGERLTQFQIEKINQERKNLMETFKILQRDGLIKEYEYRAIKSAASTSIETVDDVKDWLNTVKSRKGSI